MIAQLSRSLMNKKITALTAALTTTLLCTFAGTGLAQANFPPGGGPSPEMQKTLAAMRPIFDLIGFISLLTELDRVKGLAISKAQAQKLLPTLRDLSTRRSMSGKEADSIITSIENKLLSDPQLAWLDDTRLKRQEEARRQAASNGNGANAGGLPFGPPPGGAAGGPPAFIMAMMAGKPFNPFLDEPAKTNLKSLITLLAKR
jgi:hypothetical protein